MARYNYLPWEKEDVDYDSAAVEATLEDWRSQQKYIDSVRGNIKIRDRLMGTVSGADKVEELNYLKLVNHVLKCDLDYMSDIAQKNRSRFGEINIMQIRDLIGDILIGREKVVSTILALENALGDNLAD